MKELQQKAEAGFANFNNGQFEPAVANFEEVLKGFGQLAKGNKDLEPVYFTLAAAYFNLNQFDKALKAFKDFQVDYPKTTRLIDSTMGIAQCQLLLKNYAEAEKLFAGLENIPGRPDLREQALFLEATAYRDDKQIDKAITKLETLIKPDAKSPAGAHQDVRTALQASGAIMLTQFYVDNNPARAVELLLYLQTKITLVENVVALNQLAVKIGDDFYGKKLYKEAFACYRAVKLRNEIVRIQQQRIAALVNQIAVIRRRVLLEANPALMNTIVPIQGSIDAAKKLLEQINTLPDFGPKLYFRVATCYYELTQKWEALVVYDDLLLRFPTATKEDRESALFAEIAIMTEVATPEELDRYCGIYLKEFPDGKNKDSVGYFMASSQLQVKDPDYQKAADKLQWMLDNQKDSKFRSEMLFQLGYSRFNLGKFDMALGDFRKYQEQYGEAGANAEDVLYLAGVCQMFSGKIDEASRIIGGYIQKYGGGQYITDAKYRMLVINLSYAGAAIPKEQQGKYEQVIADSKTWEKEYPTGNQLGDVRATRADAYVSLEKMDDAIESYIGAWKAAKSDELLSYALFEASKWLQKKGDWPRIGKMFQEFVQLKGGDHPAAPTAMFWIGRAKAREGKVDEAKKFMAETIQKYIADKKIDAVEMLLSQLAQLVGKKKPSTPPPSPAPGAGPTPTPPPTVIALTTPEPKATPKPTPEPLTVPMEEYEKLLASSEGNVSPTAKARILYGKSALAEFRKNPEEHDRFIALIAEEFKPEDLSAILLAQIGDSWLGKGEVEKAATYYNRLMDDFAKSDTVEYAYAGLGEIAFRKKDYEKALEYFTDAIEKIGAGAKLKDVMIGKAKTLYELGKLEESKKIFKQIVGVREWRGDATAMSVFMVGEIEAKLDKLPEAIGYYQKVFVAYQKYAPWVAKAYLRAADCFIKLNEPDKARKHLEEMLEKKENKERLSKYPEYEEGRKRLDELKKAMDVANAK